MTDFKTILMISTSLRIIDIDLDYMVSYTCCTNLCKGGVYVFLIW